MPFAEAADYRFNPFDLTKVWPQGRLPADRGRADGARPQPGELLRRGRAGRASPREPRARASACRPDKMLMGRIFSYHDTHLHRIGANYEQLPINRPRSPCTPTTRTAQMTYRHAGDQPVYAPNSYGGPVADPAAGAEIGWGVEGAEIGRTANGQARRGRRLRPARHAVPRGHERHGARRPGRRTSSSHASDDVTARDAATRRRLLDAVDEAIGGRVAEGLGRTNGSAPGRPGRCAAHRSSWTRAPAAPERCAGRRRRARYAVVAAAASCS